MNVPQAVLIRNNWQSFNPFKNPCPICAADAERVCNAMPGEPVEDKQLPWLWNRTFSVPIHHARLMENAPTLAWEPFPHNHCFPLRLGETRPLEAFVRVEV